MATSTQTLTCTKCGYVNEPERVYCHNCGEKLDRSILPKDDDTKTHEKIEKARRRVKRLTNPSLGWKHELKTLAKTLGWAVAVAALILIAREPEDIPPMKGELGARILSSELTDAAESARPVALVFSEEDANNHLRSNVRSKAGGASIPGVKFERAFVRFEPGVCRIGMQRSVMGYHLYSQSSYKVDLSTGKLVATNVGGSFGRLPVAPWIMKYADITFKRLWSALQRERGQIEKMQSVVIEKGRITLVTRGAAR